VIAPPAAGAAEDAPAFALARSLDARRGWLATPRRRLAFALVASLALHLGLGTTLDLEPPNSEEITLTARLMPLPPPPVPSAAPTPPRPKPKAKPRPPRRVVAAEAPVAVVSDPEPPPMPVPEAAPAPMETASAPPAPEPAPPAPEPPPPAPPAPEPPPARLPPKQIDLGYIAYLGEQKFEVGPVTLKFTHDEGRYKLRIIGRGRGIAALLYPGTFTGESEGRITAEGLRPDRFVEERGNPDKRREAVFDYERHQLKLPDRDPVPFEGQPHDALTWIVQFYFATPKTDHVTLSVGTTRRMDVYTLDRAGEEDIEVATGDVDPLTGQRALRTVHTQVWKGTRKPDEDGKPNGSAIFWLSPEWHYIPFRIKVIDGKGRSASFELSAIHTE